MTIHVVNPAELVDYSSSATPSSYVCGTCGKSGVKLWREYQTFLQNQALSCADCATKRFNVDISRMTDNGKHPSYLGHTDTIGWLIPAVPTEENDTFWGYSSVPPNGCDWWTRLPLR
ncbi:MAG TPA: hypothetical protein VF597_00490 [Candidatus Saccharimonadales bacterium]|jgi:DNA-directed RNA polymerase subunit RPC12/RpoP